MQLAESEVGVVRLSMIFSDAFIEVSGISGSQIIINGEYLKAIFINIDSERTFIQFKAVISLINISSLQLSEKVNEINNSVAFGRFMGAEIEGQQLIIADYWMSFEKGLLVNQLIGNYRFFEKTLVGTARHFLKNHLPYAI